MQVARFSRSFIPTLKEAPADAQVASHKLLVRAGFIRQIAAGIYDHLPLARRAIEKIKAIIHEEMEAIGGQAFELPSLLPADLWKESGRWTTMGEEMFRLKDRRGGDYCLGMTHEEIFTAIARSELRSYRELPQIWYQLAAKFRDEPRPKSGLLRVRQFLMKDAYSFDLDNAGLDKSFELHRVAYEKIFRRCGLQFMAVKAHSGSMGGSESSEFMVRTEAGEDDVAACPKCHYAANTETATGRVPELRDDGAPAPEEFATPKVATIADLEAPPYQVSRERQLKTLIYIADKKPLLAVVRGDHALNETKLKTAAGATDLRPAQPDEIVPLMGARPGSLGAVKFTRAPVFVDHALEKRQGMVTGANRDGFHLKGVDVQRDLLAHGAKLADLRTVTPGEGCPRCDGTLEVFKALEIGHIFKLGTKYSESMGAKVLLPDGKESLIVMGCYGIGVERILAAAAELHHDADGLIWPLAIAPYRATVLTLGKEPELAQAAEQICAGLIEAGVDVLYDDRDERAGVKFKDADLLGIPIRIAVGKRGLAEGKAEWKLRRDKAVEMVPLGEVAGKAQRLLREDAAAR